jgi:hypothetical protein
MRNTTNMNPIEAALNSLKSLKPREKPNYTAVATEYSYHRSTVVGWLRLLCGCLQRMIVDAENGDAWNWRYPASSALGGCIYLAGLSPPFFFQTCAEVSRYVYKGNAFWFSINID